MDPPRRGHRLGPAALIDRLAGNGQRRTRIVAGVFLLASLAAGPARAGMPMFTLTDVATLRLRAISFFLLVFLLVTWAVQRLWNALRHDFPALPELRYRQALALVLLAGLCFNLALVMVSGARELMTPGAWVKEGALYHLASEPPPSTPRPPPPGPAPEASGSTAAPDGGPVPTLPAAVPAASPEDAR